MIWGKNEIKNAPKKEVKGLPPGSYTLFFLFFDERGQKGQKGQKYENSFIKENHIFHKKKLFLVKKCPFFPKCRKYAVSDGAKNKIWGKNEKEAGMELKIVYEIFTKCWFLYRKYHGRKIDDENAEQLVEEVKEIGDGYHCEFSVRLALATLALITDTKMETEMKGRKE